MDTFGYSNDYSSGHTSNQSILNANQIIRQRNAQAITKHQNDITKAKAKASNTDTSMGQIQTLGEAVGSQIASKGKDITATAKAVTTGLQGAKNAMFQKTPASKAVQLETKAGNIAEDGSTLTKVTTGLKNMTAVGETVGERAADIGKMGLGGAGLSAGLGLIDGVNDIASGKIVGNNAAERVSNVAQMASGALEALGTGLDLTGAGAPVGVALNILGGLSGLVSAGAEEVGESEDKSKADKNLTALKQQTVPQQKLIGIDTGSAAVVKPN